MSTINQQEEPEKSLDSKAIVVKDIPIGVSLAAIEEIKRAKREGQAGYFRFQAEAEGNRNFFKFSWDEPNYDDFALEVDEDVTLVVDGLTLAYCYELYDLDFDGVRYILRKRATTV